MSLNKCQVIKYPSSFSISPTCLSFDSSSFASCQIGAPEAVVRRNISSKSWVCHLLNTDPSNPLGMQFLFRRTTSISLKIKKTMISHPMNATMKGFFRIVPWETMIKTHWAVTIATKLKRWRNTMATKRWLIRPGSTVNWKKKTWHMFWGAACLSNSEKVSACWVYVVVRKKNNLMVRHCKGKYLPLGSWWCFFSCS